MLWNVAFDDGDLTVSNGRLFAELTTEPAWICNPSQQAAASQYRSVKLDARHCAGGEMDMPTADNFGEAAAHVWLMTNAENALYWKARQISKQFFCVDSRSQARFHANGNPAFSKLGCQCFGGLPSTNQRAVKNQLGCLFALIEPLSQLRQLPSTPIS